MSRSRSLPESAEIVIVGGGVMGASIAFHLAEAGVTDVLLLDKGELGGGSTCKAAGGVRAQFSDAVNIALGSRSLVAFENFPMRPGQQIDLHQPGYLFLQTTPESRTAAEESVALQNSMGVPTRMLTPREVAELCPAVVTDDVLSGTFHSRDGYCSPESVVMGYAGAARRLGASVVTGIEVLGIEASGSQITSVATTGGSVRCGAVVNAAGPWARAVGEMVGVDLPVDPLRRQILVTEPLPESLLEAFPATIPMTIDADTTFYFHREGPSLLFGMSYKGEGFGFHENFSEEWMADLMDAVEKRAPALLDVGVAHRWAGLYEVTPDHNALIGESETVSRFLYATGFSGHGFLQGPAVGEVIRDMWLGRETVVDVSSLDARRFVSGDALLEHNIV